MRILKDKLVVLAPDYIKTIDIVSGAIDNSKPAPPVSSTSSVLADDSILTIVDEHWLLCRNLKCIDLGDAPAGIRLLSPLHDDWLFATTESGLDLAVRVRDSALESFYLPGGSQE